MYKFRGRRNWIILTQCLAFLSTAATTIAVITGQRPALLLHKLAYVCLPCSYFCLPIAWAWLVNCLPWNRPKRAASIAITSCFSSMGNAYVLLTTFMSIYEDDRRLNLRHLSVLMGLEIGALVAAAILGRLLLQSNRYLDRLQEENPEIGRGVSSSGQEGRTSDLEVEFRFPV